MLIVLNDAYVRIKVYRECLLISPLPKLNTFLKKKIDIKNLLRIQQVGPFFN